MVAEQYPDKKSLEDLGEAFRAHSGGYSPSALTLADMTSAHIEALNERINALERRLQEVSDTALQALSLASNPVRLT